MVTKTLLSAGAAIGPGPITNFPSSDNIRVFQFNPRTSQGFSGSVTIESSFAASPGNNDFQTIVTVTFTGHMNNFSLDVDTDAPWVRARLVSSTLGQVTVFGTSRSGNITGSSGTTLANATAVVESPLRVAATGLKVHVTSPVVPQISSDDVAYALDPVNKTVTDVLSDLITATGFTASAADVDLLKDLSSGTGPCGVALTQTDFCKLSTSATLSDLNRLAGVTSNVQTQLDGKVDGAGVDLTGLTVPAAWMNTFFDVNPTIAVSSLSTALTGLTASAADLNVLTGTAGTFTAADLAKLGSITASASEVNKLNGFTGTATDLNKLSGLTSTTADLNAIDGLGSTTVTATELGYLSGLTQNVQTALSGIPSLSGLTATVSDLNLLQGASTGTSGYSGVITKNEIDALDGITSNIQNQLDAKRNTADCIGVGEICGASINIIELNYLQGSTSNIQAQIDALTGSSITTSGGTFVAPIYIADGTAGAPGLGYAGANTTGLYLEGTPGIGLTVAGVRAASLDSSWLRVGDNSTTGQPWLNASTSPNASNPAYTFNMDPDTGMYWAGSADSVALGIGGQGIVEAAATPAPGKPNLNLGGAVAQNFTVGVEGIFEGEKLLGRATVSAGGATTGQTPLYTVPSGRSAIVTKILVRLANVAGFGGPANPLVMNIGYTGPSYDEIVDNAITAPNIWNPGTYTFGTVGQVMPLGFGDNTFPAICGSSGADYGVVSATQTVTANVISSANATTWDMDVMVFGVEF